MRALHCIAALFFLTTTSAWSEPVTSEGTAIRLAADAIHKFHLTTLKDECGRLDVIEKPAYFDIVLRERHTQSCGGTTETAPRLFSVRVSKRDGRLTSDAYDGVNYKPVDRTLDHGISR
jgi:hypothetical protein